jgi:glycosyltransferase involved in cell wall biosynthesis
MSFESSLEVVGPFKGSSGYDRHTREFVREFVRQGVSVKLTPLTGWSPDLPRELRETWFDSLDAPVSAATLLHFTMPTQALPRAGKRNVNYTMFEAEQIPQSWAACAQLHDLIVVPTESSYQAWASTGVPETRLRLCPLGVDGQYFSTPAPPAPLRTAAGRALDSYRHRFLNIAELRPRKNHLGLLRCWIRATTAADDAVLILKTSAFQEGVLDEFQADLFAMQQHIGRSLHEAAPVLFIPDVVSNHMVRSLYASATHYLSFSHGEGWDQVMMEAAAAGLQLIAPKHSAYLTYLNEEEAYLIPAALRPARFEGKMGLADWAWFAGLRWWEPDEDAAVEIIHSIVHDRAAVKRSPQSRIARDYTWEKAAHTLLELIL